MSSFYMFKFGERKVFPCCCHWYECYHSVKDIERDLKKQPVIQLKHICINDFKKVSKQSTIHLKNSFTENNSKIKFVEHSENEESENSQDKTNNQKLDRLHQCGHRQCSLQYTDRMPNVHLSNVFVSANMLDRDSTVIKDQEPAIYKARGGEQSLPNTKTEQLLNSPNNQLEEKGGKRTSAETQGLITEMVNFGKKPFSKHNSDKNCISCKLQGYEKQSKEFRVNDFYRNVYKTQKETKENIEDRKGKFSEENKDSVDLSLPSKITCMQNSNVTAKLFDTSVKGSQEHAKKTYLASHDKSSSAIDNSQCKYTMSPCKVVLSSCFDNVIGKQWKSVKETAIRRYFEQEKGIKKELKVGFASLKRQSSYEGSEGNGDSDTTSWYPLSDNNVSSLSSSSSLSSISSLSNASTNSLSNASTNSLSNGSTYKSRKRLFESIDHGNQINHFPNSDRLARSTRYTGSYSYDDYFQNNSDELEIVRPKKRRFKSLQTTLSSKNEKKNMFVNKTSKIFQNSVIKNEEILRENFSLSPCKVELKKLDLEKIQCCDNKVSRREFNDLSFIELFGNSDMNMGQTYGALEYRGRLRRNPKQRDSYASDWQRRTLVKRKQLMTKDLTRKKSSKWQKKREEKLRNEAHSLRKSLDFINKRFINQNSLRTLLFMESSETYEKCV